MTRAQAPSNYVLIDDMETTTHGPILFSTGITDPLTQGYWYNSGAAYDGSEGGVSDTSDPPQMSFMFSALPAQMFTAGCNLSKSAARQFCTLNGLYDTCGVGFEFAQEPDPNPDAGALSAADPADAGVGEPKLTVPFDISRYKAITFWGMTTTPDPITGSLQVKVQLPDTDTDPRGQICNGGGGNTSKCYNSYAAYLEFKTTWQQFTVLLDPASTASLRKAASPSTKLGATSRRSGSRPRSTASTGRRRGTWARTEGPPLMTDIWVDDVYFVE